ncbi:MAG: NAD(P)/FAD-dependent oxidoreductase [Thermoplasmatota archaeon]
MVFDYDLVVIGSGAAAQTVVYSCADAGLDVALIEEQAFGGTCALRGCIPKKILVGATEAVDQMKKLSGKGPSGEKLRIDWSDLISFKKTFTESTPESVEKSLRDADIDIFKGHGSFVDTKTVKINDQHISSKHFFIATGAKPRPLQIDGEQYVCTSDDFFHLKQLPSSIAFIGGGYISFELAHIAARAGANVTILHRSDQPLGQFDSDLVKTLIDASEELGIRLLTNMPVHAVEKTSDMFQVIAGKNIEKVKADLVMHGAGRIPNIDHLSLDNAQVIWSKKGITVNESMQSVSNPRVFAAGDVAANGLPLTPVAGAEGKVVRDNLIGRSRQFKTGVIPSTLFTIPPLSSVGLTEEKARKQGLFFQVNAQDTSSWYTSRRIGLKHSGYKILIDKKTDQILGAHLLGHHAEEVINIFALAMQQKITQGALKEMIWSYPTSTYDINYML